MDTTFTMGRIDRCPKCDSEKIVFPESWGRKKEKESRGIKWRCSDCGCAGYQSGCIVVVTRGDEKGTLSNSSVGRPLR
jgi:hypothetical protein